MTLFEGHEPAELLPYDGSALLWSSVLGVREAGTAFARLLDEVDWESGSIMLFGREVPQPRLYSWYGDLAYTYSGLTMKPRPWTPQLAELLNLCESISGARFNSVLVNLYRNGLDSMGWHADDEPELGREPVIASLSLGATRRFRLRHGTTRDVIARDLTNGSLLVMSGLCQHHWKHEVPKQRSISDARINLTFRWIHPELLHARG